MRLEHICVIDLVIGGKNARIITALARSGFLSLYRERAKRAREIYTSRVYTDLCNWLMLTTTGRRISRARVVNQPRRRILPCPKLRFSSANELQRRYVHDTGEIFRSFLSSL